MRAATMLRLLAGFLLAGLILAPSQVVEAQESTTADSCDFNPDTTVDVLLLLDQSASLDRTDPSDQRVPAAKAVLASFATLAQRIDGVRVNIAGFGTDFGPQGWVDLDESSRDQLVAQVDAFRDRDDDQHTDYAEALHGVVEEFRESTASCKILYWFTDGQHDLERGRFGSGMARSYPTDDPVVVTDENHEEVEAMMSAVVCDPGGYADQLGEQGVGTDVWLLGSGDDVDEQSRRVLQGMGGRESFDCGPGQGSYQDVSEAADLPFQFACSSQFGLTSVPLSGPADGTLTITDTDVDASGIPYVLATNIRIIADGGPTGTPSLADTSDSGVETTTTSPESNLLEVDLTPTESTLELSLTGVIRACGFVAGVAPTPEITSNSPSLYQGESGVFTVIVNGPRGRIIGDDLEAISLEADQGEPTQGDEGWSLEVDELPRSEVFELAVTVSAEGLPPRTETESFTLNQPVNAPRIVSQPPPLEGEGTGPFIVPLEVDGRDGGTICLAESSASMRDLIDESNVQVSASFEGDDCIEVGPGSGQSVDLVVGTNHQADAHEVLEFRTTSTPLARPDQSEVGVISLDLKVLPLVNNTVFWLVLAGLLVLLLLLLWAIMYGINRLVSRIPDARRNRVRYADFVAEVRADDGGGLVADLVEAPTSDRLHVPRTSPGHMDAGRLKIMRRVPIVPWIPPFAEMTMGTDVVAVSTGRDANQLVASSNKKAKTSSQKAKGPLVSLGLSDTQMSRAREGQPQRAVGTVILDSRDARGQDAGGYSTALIEDGLAAIAADWTARDVSQRGRMGEE